MMDNPKIYLATFILSILVLTLVIFIQPKDNGEVDSGIVISQTLTQSLDGHRRYLNVRTQHDKLILIQAPEATQCPKGYNVTFKVKQDPATAITSYKFVSCSP
ncbi:hypothetical protein [Vibrio japonicus]|uniref:Uncharacterized protein n=1 Tax=Vibrio japonicus TaxID=1824638 RepID=A0ABY5LP64_9VIBR|nr:hypothetical protein [Vibrio japonicus]UUM32509.1 hypothetical protein NP165_19780 [Vibrio japonicus]